MAKRYFNWKLAIVLVIGVVVLGITAFGLRQWQRAGRAEQGLILGNKAYEEHEWEEAAKELGRYLAVKQDDVPVLLKYADAQLNIRPLKAGNIQQATTAYRTVLRMDADDFEAAMRLTKVYLGMGTHGEAELIAKRQLETKNDPRLRRMLALALAGQRKFSEAVTELKAILQEHPDQISAYETLGQLIEQRPEDFTDPPVYWFNQAVKDNPSSALAYIIRAGFYLRNKDRPNALADLEQAEKQDLSESAVQLRLAGGFIDVNVLDKAEKHLTAVQAATPADQGLWQSWAQLALKSQSQEKMVTIAETGLEELSSQPWDFMPIATDLFVRGGQLERAADCIYELRQKDIFHAAVAYLEGFVADQKGHTYEAVKCWHRAMELGDKSTRTRLMLASALSRLGDKQSALQQLRTLVAERPDSFEGRLTLARLLSQSRNWAETAEHARRAMQLSPGNFEAALLHSQAWLQLLAASSTSENVQMRQDMEKQLSALEKATDGAAEVKLLQFHLAMQQGDFAGAEVLVSQLKKAHLARLKTAMAEVELLAAQNETEEAILILNETIEEFPEAIGPVRYLAVLLAQQGNHKECETVMKDALARIERPFAQRELGLLLVRFYSLWDWKDSVYPLLNTLAQKLPNDILIKRRLLLCEQVIKDPEKTQQFINEIKSFEGEDGWQWRYEQARIWYTMDDFEESYPRIISLLQENLLSNPDDQASRVLLAAAYERAGELQLAISTYRDALNRSPADLRIIIPAVAALYKAREYDQADEILNRASQQELYHPQLQQLQLQSYLRHGQLNSASDILQDVLNNDPDNQAACLSLALLKIQQEKFDEAEELLTRLKIQDPTSLPVTAAQIQINIHRNKPADALKLCDEIVNNLNNAPAYILRARTCAAMGQTDRAIEDLERATTVEPNNVEAWVARSDFYNSLGQPDKAIADVQQALSLASNDVQIQKRAILLFLASEDTSKVRQGRTILDEALGSNPDDTELRLFKARLLLTEKTAPATENAERILQEIIEERPAFSQAWALLGEISLSQGQPARAMDAALRGLSRKSDDKRLLLLKARAEAVRSPLLAIATLNVLRELDPNDIDIARYLASTYIAAGESQEAVNLLREQLTVCDASTRRTCNIALAVALYKNGNKADAQKEFDSLLQSEPNDPAPLLAKAPLLKDDGLWGQLVQNVADWYQKRPKDNQTPLSIAKDLINEDGQAKKAAEDILRMILKNDSDYTEAMNVLAILLQATDRSAESAELYQRLLTLEPDNLIAINNLAWIMCEKQGKYRQSLDLAQRGLKIAPNYIDLIDTRGVAYYRLGQFSKAVQDFTTCIELYPKGMPSTVASHFHLARAFAGLGQRDKAVEHLNQSLDLESRIGGLLTTDLAEAQRLLERLQKGS
ncbi:MAG: tetratricopeptide repeat protein [Planctomycetota bacterium]|jgi:tetratricopeptide (TPR) repeat protein